MKFPYPPEERIDAFIERLSRDLGLTKAPEPGAHVETLRAYPDLSTGLNEIARGLVRMYPHKRKLGYLRGGGLHFEPLVKSLSIEGILAEPLDVKDLSKSEEWLSKLSKDGLMFLDVIDDPMTGEIFSLHELRTQLAAKKIFTLSVSHNAHLCRELPALHQFAAHFMNVSDSISVARLGLKCSKLPAMVVGLSEWTRGFDLDHLNLYPKVVEDQNLVESFEQKILSIAKPFFSGGAHRLFDRLAIEFTDADGEALISELSEALGISLRQPGQEDRLETTSGCRWGGYEFFKFYEDQGISQERLRGLVLISVALIKSDIDIRIAEAHKRVIALQNG
jgi:hypothetical protein